MLEGKREVIKVLIFFFFKSSMEKDYFGILKFVIYYKMINYVIKKEISKIRI